MPTSYAPAPEIKEIAESLIASIPDHADLAPIRVEYIFRDVATRRGGRAVLAKARHIKGLPAFLARKRRHDGDFFVLEVAADTWNSLDSDKRHALIDHELCHFHVASADPPEAPDINLVHHDIEEFAGVIRRHGLWAADITEFSAAVYEQLALAVDQVSDFLKDAADPDT